MKLWMVFVLVTVVCWGAYVPMLHTGQKALGKDSALRAFLFVGLAYLIVSIVVLAYVKFSGAEPLEFTRKGGFISTFAGILGAVGALGIVFALRKTSGGHPLVVAPLVFAGAPIVNTFVSMMLHKPATAPSPWFYAGIVVAASGAALVLKFKPL